MTKKLTETSAGGRGERDIGSDAYADYTKNITPGQSAGTVPAVNPSITDADAKKADKKQKEDNAQKNRQATVVDDEYHPRVPMPVHEFLGIPFSAAGRLRRQQNKARKLKTRTDLATAKMGNIAARQKLKDTKAKLRDMRTGAVTAEYQPEAVTQAQLDKIQKSKQKGHLDMDDRSLPSRDQQITDPKQLAALHKLKQKVLGKDYDKKEEVGMSQRARLSQALKKMHNEFVPENGDHPPKKAHKHDKKKDKPEQGKVYALTGKSSDANIARGDSWKDSEVKK